MSKHIELARATLKGTIWNYGSFVLGKSLIFITTLILARLLLPEQFGLMAIGLLVISYLDRFADLGVGAALIYRQEDPDRASSVAFLLSAGMGGVLAATAYYTAPLVADFFSAPEAVSIIQVLALSFIISGLSNIFASRVKKELHFKRRFIAEIGKSIAKGGLSIGLAFSGFGVWSLVYGQLAGELTAALLYWLMTSWRPRFIIDPDLTRSLLHYGWQIVLVGILGAILKNIDYVIIGRRMDITQLGYYTMAFRLPELAILSFCYVVSQALFPAYSKLQNDWPALRAGVRVSMRYVSLITIPAGVGLAIIAPEFIRIFYTEKWAPAIPVMQALSIYAMVETISFNSGDVYKAVGRPNILNRVGLFKLLIAIPVLWYAAEFTIFHVALAQVIVATVCSLLSLFIACRIITLSPVALLRAIAPSLISTFVMALGMIGLRFWLKPLGDAATLALLIATGIMLFCVTLWLTHRQLVGDMLIFMRARKTNNAVS